MYNVYNLVARLFQFLEHCLHFTVIKSGCIINHRKTTLLTRSKKCVYSARLGIWYCNCYIIVYHGITVSIYESSFFKFQEEVSTKRARLEPDSTDPPAPGPSRAPSEGSSQGSSPGAGSSRGSGAPPGPPPPYDYTASSRFTNLS